MFRAGDVVSVKATVRYDQREGEKLYIEVGHSPVTAEPTEVTMVTPRWDAGETVFVREHGPEHEPVKAQVIATNRGKVWVELEDGTHLTVGVMCLERIPSQASVGA